ARRDRPESGGNGGGAALRSQRPQFRHPGIYAPHRRDRSRLPARLRLRARRDASRRCAGPRRRHRRSPRTDLSLPPLPSPRPPRSTPPPRRDGALMVRRREFLGAAVAAAAVGRHFSVAAATLKGRATSADVGRHFSVAERVNVAEPTGMRFGYAAITWGANI